MRLKDVTLPLAALAAFAIAAPAIADSAEPVAGTDVLAVARDNGQFNTLARAIEAAGLSSTLAGPGPFTILAPTDEAFAKLPAGELESLLKPENKDQLVKLLSYHVVPGEAYDPDELKRKRTVPTVAGEPVKVALVNGRLRVGDARVKGDVEASNGVILPIDRVLIPQ